MVLPAPGGAWSRTVFPGRTAEQICLNRASIGNWLNAVLPLDSRDEIHQAEKHQAADGADGRQQPHKRADGNDKGGHEDFLKGRIDSGLVPLSVALLHSFARLYRSPVLGQRTWRVPSTGWYSSPVSSSNTMAGSPVSNMVCRASLR